MAKASVRIRLGRWMGGFAVPAALAMGAPAGAQEATVYATGSIDGYETSIVLVGTSVRAGGLGIQPVAGLQVYRLDYQSGAVNVGRWSVMPSVGVANRFATGSVEARVGYAFTDEDTDAPFVDAEGGSGGVNTAVHGNYWGSGGTSPELQGIASYSWGSEYLWSQVQAAVPVLQLGAGRVSVGGEAVWQGQLAGDDRYSSRQLGPLVKWSTGHDSAITLGGGWKDSNSREPTWYARIGLVKYGIGL